ncbi:MAG: hypothetical protein WDA03_04815 [Trueperaceae bacterium]
MKRLILWTVNMLFLTLLSAASAAPLTADLAALTAAETSRVMAGECPTCNPNPYPTIRHEGWDLIKSNTSSKVTINTRLVRPYPNPTPHTSAKHTVSYSDECQNRWVSGSVSIGRGLGISIGTTYHCNRNQTLEFTVPPGKTVLLMEGTDRWYVTVTYRHYIQWSDGYREITGLTETFRQENTVKYQYLQ